MFKALLVVTLCVIWTVVICSQILLPLLRGRRLFPALRYRDLYSEIGDLQEQVERRELEDARDDLADSLDDAPTVYNQEEK